MAAPPPAYLHQYYLGRQLKRTGCEQLPRGDWFTPWPLRMAFLQPLGGQEVTCNDTAILQDAGGKEEPELFDSASLAFSCVVLFLQYSLSHT